MDNMLKEFNEIADRTLNKVFMLKNRTYRQIDIQNVDNLLSTDQMMLEKCKVNFNFLNGIISFAFRNGCRKNVRKSGLLFGQNIPCFFIP